jgi:NAD(P)-dependent dehydrogenase (short-subunit alcohol dehydrogenase family)
MHFGKEPVMATVLITGSNRGIGLELCRQFTSRGDIVVATCRKTTSELDSLGVQVIEGIDVTDDAAVQSLADEIRGTSINVLVHNAGILTREGFEDLDIEGIRRQFEVNTLGPLRVTKALLPALDRGAKIVIITSLMGSLDDNASGGHYGYRISKAGVNMVGVNLAHEFRSRGIAVGILHPGMVATDMTGGRGIPAEESVKGLIARIDELDMGITGSFRHAKGGDLPW